jgi:nickel-dependent lactate racemase
MEMEEAAHFAQVNFTVNVVMNSNNEIVKAYAGGLDQVFQEGVKLVDEMFKINVAKPVDIVIVSSGGYPQDINLYQAYKGIDSVKNIVKDNGVILLVAECPEGYGNKYFYDWMVKYKSFKAIQKSIKKNFVVGSNVAYYLLKMLERVKIILVSSMPDYYARRIFKMRTDKTLNSAITSAFRIVGRKSKVLVVPKGAAILPILNNPQKREIK